MNDTSGVQEVRPPILPVTIVSLPVQTTASTRNRFLAPSPSSQSHRSRSTRISTKPKSFPTPVQRPQEQVMGVEVHKGSTHLSPGNMVHELCTEARVG